MIKGYAGRVLEVDLAAWSFSFEPLDEEIARLYIGGKGYGTRLLYDRTRPGIDPLGPENLLIFATGPLNGSVAPQSNRFAVVCKSPLTGGIGNATCGGSFALGMKKAGIDVLVLKGVSADPVRLQIDGDTDSGKAIKRKRHGPEQIIQKLREAEILLQKGQDVPRVCRAIGVTPQTYYRWRKEYGGMRADPAKRLKELEKENARLKKLVAGQALDMAILKDVASGDF